jgi:hypothetical protein
MVEMVVVVEEQVLILQLQELELPHKDLMEEMELEIQAHLMLVLEAEELVLMAQILQMQVQEELEEQEKILQ